MLMKNPVRLFLLLSFATLSVLPFVVGEFYLDLFTNLMIMGIFAMSLDLLIGYTGLVSFGHAAFFGLTGYLLAIVTPESAALSIWISLPVALIGAAVAALVIGWFSVRTSGVYFIMITLAFAQMMFYYFNENGDLGGSDGMFIFSKPQVFIGNYQIVDLSKPMNVYFLVLVSLVASYFLLKRILNAPFGQVIQAIRVNEHRTLALGYNTKNYKLVIFIIAGTLAGFAGYLEALSTGIVSPGALNWHESGLAMMVVILGGMGTLYGPVIGAFVLGLLHDQVQEITEYWLLVQGIFVILIVIFLPNGIAGLISKRSGKKMDDKDTGHE